MPVKNSPVGTDDLVTITICGVFFFTLWKMRANHIEQAMVQAENQKQEVVQRPVYHFFSITDCFGDVIHTNPFLFNNDVPVRSSTPYSDTTESTIMTVGTADTKDKWEFVDTDDDHLIGEDDLA